MSNSDITLSRNVLEMAAVASEFCSFIENSNNASKQDFFKTLQGLIPLIYLRGTLLPKIEPEYPEANEHFVNEEQWEGIFYALREITSADDEFWYVDNSETQISETIKGSIAEHLADVYQDIKDFILLYKKPQYAARENAVASCQTNFIDNWGRKLAELLPVIHQLTENEYDDEEFDY